MRRGALLLALGLAALGVLAAAYYGLLRVMRDQGGFWYEAWRLMFGVPLSLERVLMAAAVLLAAGALLVTPVAFVERHSARAFDAQADALRRERPDDAVTPYAGVEGEGLSFDGPQGRLLLLRGEQGVGAPRVLDAAPPPPAERPSP